MDIVFVDLPDENDEIALNLILNSERTRGRLIPEKLVPLLEEMELHPAFALTRLNVMLDEHRITTMRDDFQPEKPKDERGDGVELESEGDEPKEKKDDDVKYLRLHYTQEEASELEDKLAAYMKENKIGSMTEALLTMLEQV